MHRRRLLSLIGAAALAGCTSAVAPSTGPTTDTLPTEGGPDSEGRNTTSTTPTETPDAPGNNGSVVVVLEGRTTYDDEWTVQLVAGTEYVLELTQQEGIYATVGVQRKSDAETVVKLETKDIGTVSKRFTVPSDEEYLVILQANGADSPRGKASLVIRVA